MVFVDPDIAATVAHLDGVVAAVKLERDAIARVAEALFAPHDHPGRHEITTHDDVDHRTDALVSLVGPAAMSVEYGHWTADHKRHVEGLHILGRAIAQESA